jgi:hypothetical protein
MINGQKGYYAALSDISLNKPEQVIDFPEWLLSEKHVGDYRSLDRAAIVEIAGRDSIAAAVASVEKQRFTDFIPVYAYTGTEFGQWENVIQAVQRLSHRLPDVRVHPLIVMGSPKFWRAINGRFVSDLYLRFGFYSPCPGCHLYLHAVRIPLARKLGGIPVISGERELHTGMVKINQTPEALDFYLDFADQFEIRLLFPLRHISSGDEIERIIGFPWKRGKDQLDCVISQNYKTIDNTKEISSSEIKHFFHQFAGPAARSIVSSYISGKVPEHNTIAGDILKKMATH